MPGWTTNGVTAWTSANLVGNEEVSVDTQLASGQSPQTAAPSVESFGGFSGSLTNAAVTAFSTGGQASATPLGMGMNIVTTVAAAADSVALPLAARIGQKVTVHNAAAANAMQVFGSGTDTINNVATATGVSQAHQVVAQYICTKVAPAGNWARVLGG